MSIDRYVTSLRAHLAVVSPGAADVAEEMRGHLEDAACDLQMAGLPPRESECEAVRRFGTPDEIVAALVAAQDRRDDHASMYARLRLRVGAAAWPRHIRRPVAALLVAAALAALGGGAVASAHEGIRTGPSAPPRQRTQAQIRADTMGSSATTYGRGSGYGEAGGWR